MSAIDKCSFTVICIVMSISCGAGQISSANQPSEKFSNYYQKPMRNIDIQLMDEVLEYASADIKNMIDTINDLSKRESIRLLLVGGPGVGKTTLAQAIAMQTNRPCFIIRAPSLANQYQFSGEQNLISAISPLFDIDEPCIVIIDEIDALKQYKGDKNNQDACPANTLCNLLDDAEDHPNIVFIATTNKLKQLPEDLKSRFGSIITLPLPDECARERIIRYHLEQLKKTGINLEIDDKTIKSLAAKTKGFSARDLKAMIIKGKIYDRNIRSNCLKKAADTITSYDVWQAFKEQKPLIAAGWHVKERIRELFENHGVVLSTFAVSTALTVLGIMINERRSVQGMTKSDEQFAYQKSRDMKAKRDELIKKYLAQEKWLFDPKWQCKNNFDYYEFLHIKLTLAALKNKLAGHIAKPGSKERSHFEQEYCFYIKNLMWLEGIDKKTFSTGKEFLKEHGAEVLAKFEKCDNLLFASHKGDDIISEYYKKVDQLISLARRSEIVSEVNEADLKLQTVVRERREGFWPRMWEGFTFAGLGAFFQSLLKPG